nr:DNA cytosine methyltransferase [Nocardia mangyaensis]
MNHRTKVGDGTTYRWWLRQFDNLGYRYVELRLDSIVFGVPQSRDRLYVVYLDTLGLVGLVRELEKGPVLVASRACRCGDPRRGQLPRPGWRVIRHHGLRFRGSRARTARWLGAASLRGARAGVPRTPG